MINVLHAGEGESPFYVDVNNDRFVSPLDALLIINMLQRIPDLESQRGEGEASLLGVEASTATPLDVSHESLALPELVTIAHADPIRPVATARASSELLRPRPKVTLSRDEELLLKSRSAPGPLGSVDG